MPQESTFPEPTPHAPSWSEITSLPDIIVRNAVRHPDRDAVVFPDFRLSHQELLDRSVQVARGLVGLGVMAGEHVGLIASNGVEFLEGFFGASMIGAVVVPINVRHKASELQFIIRDADLSAVLTVSEPDQHVDFVDLLTESIPGLGGRESGAALTLPEVPRLRVAALLAGDNRRGFVGRSDFDSAGATVDPSLVHELRSRIRIRDVAAILYTSGTTANPKGCMLTHEALTRGPVERATRRFVTDGPHVSWGAGPLFHIGSMAPMIGALGAGGTYLTDVFFDAGRALELMRRERPTTAWPWFPAIMQALLNHPDFDARLLDSVRYMLLIGPPVLISTVQDLFPHAELVAACGMTETAGIYALSDESETVEDRSTAQGKPAPGIEVRIVDPFTGEDQPAGEPGEMLVRGFCVTDGYYNSPEKTAEAIDDDGWFHTSDLYSWTDRGCLQFRGRMKDMLKVGGENVAALEIESFLCEHPAVAMASVIGVPDDMLDEVPVAFIELRDGYRAADADLRAYCEGKISRYKIPREFHFLAGDQWPMSTTKINKGGLRKIFDSSQMSAL